MLQECNNCYIASLFRGRKLARKNVMEGPSVIAGEMESQSHGMKWSHDRVLDFMVMESQLGVHTMTVREQQEHTQTAGRQHVSTCTCTCTCMYEILFSTKYFTCFLRASACIHEKGSSM